MATADKMMRLIQQPKLMVMCSGNAQLMARRSRDKRSLAAEVLFAYTTPAPYTLTPDDFCGGSLICVLRIRVR